MHGAVHEDVGRPKIEVVPAETGSTVVGCLYAAQSLEEWAKPEKPTVEAWRSSYDTTVFKVPKGVVLIIAFVPVIINYPTYCQLKYLVLDLGITRYLSLYGL